MSSNKDGAISWEFIAIGILVLVVVVVVLVLFSRGADKGFGGLIEGIEGSKDSDLDGVPDLQDFCKCDASVQKKEDLAAGASCSEDDCKE